MSTCTITSGCISCPAVPPSPGSPPSVSLSDNIGWNAGADSSAYLTDLNLHYTFTMPEVAGVITGFKTSTDGIGIPFFITHGLGFKHDDDHSLLFYVVEGGAVVFGTLPYTAGDAFEIRRIGELVTYWHNGRKIYSSLAHSVGGLYASACLYATGDAINDEVFEALTAESVDVFITETADIVVAFKGKIVSLVETADTVAAHARIAEIVSVLAPNDAVYASDMTAYAALIAPSDTVFAASYAAPPTANALVDVGQDRASGTGYRIVSADATLTDAALVYASNMHAYAFVITPEDTVQASNITPFDHAYGVAMMSPGFAYATSDSSVQLVFDDVVRTQELIGYLAGLVFNENVQLADVLGTTGARSMTIADLVEADDQTSLVQLLIFAQTVSAADVLTLDYTKLMDMVDVLMATDDLLTQRQAMMAIAVAVVASQTGGPLWFVDLSQSLAATDTNVLAVQHVMQLMEVAEIADSLSNTLSMLMVLNDSVDAADAVSMLRAALMNIDETLFVGGRFVFDGIDYVIYSVQPEGYAVSEYDGWGFNSMTRIGDKLYGADDRGLSVLEGDDDAGTPIDASIYTGLSNFGTNRFKAVPEVLLGLTGDGSMLLKVVSTNKDKTKRENWYKLAARSRENQSNARFIPSKGIHSEYLGFVLENIDGSDFDVDFVKAWVVALNRRANNG